MSAPAQCGGRRAAVIGPDHPAVAGRTGAGVTVAVIDSGVHPGHPHIGAIAGGVGISEDAGFQSDVLDRLGHGTAVTAAVQEKAPDVDLYVVKVFDRSLSTTVEALVAALDWATSRGIRLVNLSLGTANPGSAAVLAEAVARSTAVGTLVVSARDHDGRRWYPGSLDGVIGVRLDPGRARDCVELVARGGELTCQASGFPRPIPGVPPERNLKGVSFAVANATGMLARILQDRPEVGTADDLARLLPFLSGLDRPDDLGSHEARSSAG